MILQVPKRTDVQYLGGASWGDLYGYNYTILTPKQIGIRPSNYADTHIYIYIYAKSIKAIILPSLT